MKQRELDEWIEVVIILIYFIFGMFIGNLFGGGLIR